MEHIAHLVSQYGYFGIFSLLMLGIVGLPVPDEWLMTFAGFLIYKQTLRPLPTIVSALLGSACGITLSYILGRTLGLYVIHRYGAYFHITQKRMDRVHDWFGRIGTWSLLVGYFIPGVRHLTAIVAGTSGLPVWTFGTFAYAGAAIWVGTFVSIGYFFGDKWNQVFEVIHAHLKTAGWIAAAVVAMYLLIRFYLWRRKSVS
jgi:membrane protein DedA with SNARE-associated domain